MHLHNIFSSGSAACALHGVTLRMFTFQRRDVIHVGFLHCRYICMNHSLIGPSLSEYLFVFANTFIYLLINIIFFFFFCVLITLITHILFGQKDQFCIGLDCVLFSLFIIFKFFVVILFTYLSISHLVR